MPLAHRWTDSHRAAGVTCYRDCPWLCSENWRTLHFLRLRQFYPGTVRVRFVMNHAALGASVFSCHYHWITAACPSGSVCAFYQKNNVLFCDTWGSRTNCNTEMVQSIATLNTVLVKKIVVLFVQVSQHKPSISLSLTFPSYLLQVFTLGNKYNLI